MSGKERRGKHLTRASWEAGCLLEGGRERHPSYRVFTTSPISTSLTDFPVAGTALEPILGAWAPQPIPCLQLRTNPPTLSRSLALSLQAHTFSHDSDGQQRRDTLLITQEIHCQGHQARPGQPTSWGAAPPLGGPGSTVHSTSLGCVLDPSRPRPAAHPAVFVYFRPASPSTL